MTRATHLAATTIASMIAAVEEEVMADETTVVAVIMMIEIEDTVEDVTATMMVLASTATVMIGMIDEVVEVATTTATTEVGTVTVAAPVMHHQQPNMVIQLLVRSLGNLMVAATPMRELMLVENSDC